MKKYYKVGSIVFGMILFVLMFYVYNKKIIKIDIDDEDLQKIEKVAPSKDYVFYVPSNSLPKSMDELNGHILLTCVTNTTLYIQGHVLLALKGVSGFNWIGKSGFSCSKGIIGKSNFILLSERKNMIFSYPSLLEINFF